MGRALAVRTPRGWILGASPDMTEKRAVPGSLKHRVTLLFKEPGSNCRYPVRPGMTGRCPQIAKKPRMA